jgi:hypothetical protein
MSDKGRLAPILSRTPAFTLLRRIHMYLGLMSWSSLLVFGIAGLTGTFRSGPEAPTRDKAVRFESFTVPANLTDKQVAHLVWNTLQIPLTAPEHVFGIQRDGENNLNFSIYSENGVSGVTVLEKENRLRIETERSSIWEYFDNLHGTTVNTPVTDWRIRLWTYYIEFSIWTLLAMALGGLCLWLMSRPGHRLAQVLFLFSVGSFVVLYILSR